MGESDIVDIPNTAKPLERPFQPIQLPERFWNAAFDYGSDALLTSIIERHAGDIQGINFGDINSLAIDELQYFNELVNNFLSPGIQTDRQTEQGMLEHADTLLENNTSSQTVDVSAVYDPASGRHDYQEGRAPGALFYSFNREEIDDNFDEAYTVEERQETLERIIHTTTALQNNETITKENLSLTLGWIQRKKLHWLQRIQQPHGLDQKAQRNASMLKTMENKIRERVTKSA